MLCVLIFRFLYSMELFVVTTAVFDALFPFVTSMYRQVEPIDFFSCII